MRGQGRVAEQALRRTPHAGQLQIDSKAVHRALCDGWAVLEVSVEGGGTVLLCRGGQQKPSAQDDHNCSECCLVHAQGSWEA